MKEYMPSDNKESPEEAERVPEFKDNKTYKPE
jgi:hypothetical protein